MWISNQEALETCQKVDRAVNLAAMIIKAPLSYYGGKSKLVHLYPAPIHDLIIEPFAGSAAYSWYHRRRLDGSQREIWLNDLDPRTYSIWKFLTSPDACAIVEAYVPDQVEPGMKVSDFIPPEHPGLVELCRAEANQGTMGEKGVRDVITKMGAKCWKVKRKALTVIPEVVNWKITSVDWSDLANVNATWFVDSPYNNAAGAQYRLGATTINYDPLGWWCLNRKGQVIVCENLGADWLPFEPFQHSRVSIRSRYQRSDAKEVMFHRSDRSNECIESSTKMETSSSLTPTEESQ